MKKLDASRYRVTGTSQSLPRELIVEDERGRKRLYFAATGRFSAEALSPALEAALLSGRHGRERWKRVTDGGWVDADDVRDIASIGISWPERR